MLLKIGQHSQPALIPIRSYNVWERIQIDLIDMRNNPDNGHNYLAHVIDHFSNYNILYPVKHKSAEDVSFNFSLNFLAFYFLTNVRI